jgi:hypothetical protein
VSIGGGCRPAAAAMTALSWPGRFCVFLFEGSVLSRGWNNIGVERSGRESWTYATASRQNRHQADTDTKCTALSHRWAGGRLRGGLRALPLHTSAHPTVGISLSTSAAG